MAFRFWSAISDRPNPLSFAVALSIFRVLFFQQFSVYLLIRHGIASAFTRYVNQTVFRVFSHDNLHLLPCTSLPQAALYELTTDLRRCLESPQTLPAIQSFCEDQV
jgi:hypothetical protein